MAIISIGPFLTANGKQGLITPGLEHAGFTMELAGDKLAGHLTLYRRLHDWRPGRIEFDDYFVEFDEIPFPVRCILSSIIQSPDRDFVSLNSVLAALYLDHKVARPLTAFLQEIRDHLPINHSMDQRRKDGAGLVADAVAQAGFEVIKFVSYGRTLNISLGWLFPQDRADANCKDCLYAVAVDCQPTPQRTLGKCKWLFPVESVVAFVLAKELQRLVGRNPLNVLSEEGRRVAAESFKWTKVSLMTPKEAKQARIDFIRQHPELHDNPKLMAKAMLKAELYSDTAEIYRIAKQVPKLVEKARNG